MITKPGTMTIGSPVGPLLLAASSEGLTHLLFAGQAGRLPSGDASDATGHILAETERQLGDYFAGTRREFDLPLAPAGTEFQLAVWRGLRDIAYGELISYGELARRIRRPGAARAVGAANGANPVSIIVPCHRVIGANRRLTGYGGGLAGKRFLLELEGNSLGR